MQQGIRSWQRWRREVSDSFMKKKIVMQAVHHDNQRIVIF
jgi:hypothetical protein